MDSAYFSRVSADIQQLIRQAEAAMDVEIDVLVDDSIEHMQCNVEHRRPRLITPAEDHFPDGAVAHEMLHVQRFRVEGVPMVVDDPDHEAWSIDIGRGLLSLDNSLEHLIIVPMELALRADRRTRWEASMQRVWSNGIAALPLRNDQKRQALINWCFLAHVLPDSPVIPVAEAELERLHIAVPAKQMRDEIGAAKHSKEEMVRICLRYFGLDPSIALFQYLDRRTGQRSTAPIYAHSTPQ